jgi:hypothetical protein
MVLSDVLTRATLLLARGKRAQPVMMDRRGGWRESNIGRFSPPSRGTMILMILSFSHDLGFFRMGRGSGDLNSSRGMLQASPLARQRQRHG